MYTVPHLYGATDFLQNVDPEKAELCLEDCLFKDYPCDEDVFNVCVELMSEYNLSVSDDAYEMVDMYIRLRELIISELNVE